MQQIELSDKAIELANSLASEDKDAAAVITEALARLAWERQEVDAVMQGVKDYQEGRHRPWDEFAAEFAAEHGITLDG